MEPLSESPVHVLGIGTRMSRDDEIGLRLVETLLSDEALSHRCTLLESADAASLTSLLLEERDPVMIVDCADMGASGGTARFFTEDEAKLTLRSDSVSTHGLGVADAASLAHALGFAKPVCFFAVQPFDLSPRMGLTEEMTRCLPHLNRRLRKLIGLLDGGGTIPRRVP